MSTILIEGAFRVFYFSYCLTERIHVHVDNNDGEIKIWMDDFSWQREYGQMKDRDVRRAIALVKAHQDTIRERWEADKAKLQ